MAAFDDRSVLIERDGGAWCAKFPHGFTSLMKCPAGFGPTREEALSELLKLAERGAENGREAM